MRRGRQIAGPGRKPAPTCLGFHYDRSGRFRAADTASRNHLAHPRLPDIDEGLVRRSAWARLDSLQATTQHYPEHDPSQTPVLQWPSRIRNTRDATGQEFHSPCGDMTSAGGTDVLQNSFYHREQNLDVAFELEVRPDRAGFLRIAERSREQRERTPGQAPEVLFAVAARHLSTSQCHPQGPVLGMVSVVRPR